MHRVDGRNEREKRKLLVLDTGLTREMIRERQVEHSLT